MIKDGTGVPTHFDAKSLSVDLSTRNLMRNPADDAEAGACGQLDDAGFIKR